MSEEQVRRRIRGGYAILAGVLLLLGVPLFQRLVLAPTGYLTAVNAIIAHQQFGPLLFWTAAHPAESRLFRVFEVVPFLLALGLPGPLRSVLWTERPGAGRAALWAGLLGFVLFVLALFIGMFNSAAAASSYVTTSSASARQAIALDYASRYALETLLSRVLGGISLTVFLIAVGLRMVRASRFPLWLAWLGIITAAMLAINALLFALGPAQATTPTAGLSFILLALWLIAAGLVLIRYPTTSAATHDATPS